MDEMGSFERTPPAAAVARVREGFRTRATVPRRFRVGQLKALRRLLAENEKDLAQALAEDLGKHPLESRLSEFALLEHEISHVLLHLPAWMEETSVKVPLALQPAQARVQPQPLGVVLILAPWNYPVQLLLSPLIGALAAGNCAVLKPSELAPATARLLCRLVPQYLDPQVVAIVDGGPETAAELLRERFDHIFFTGGEQVGRQVLQAASRHLTPVTLELGGKSPAVVVDGHWGNIARRIAHGKFLNAGQTCVAPDYVLVVGKAAAPLRTHLPEAIREFFGKRPARSRDYGRIVNEHHFNRLTGYLGQGTVLSGGGSEPSGRYIEPTVLVDVDPDAPVMQEEIFGPILPVLEVPSLAEAVAFVNERPAPLAAYLFSERPKYQRIFEETVRAGAVGHNICNAHPMVPGLPFGGVGASGMGAYHGRHSFDTFSQLRPVLSKSALVDTLRVAYPPYSWSKAELLKRLL
ncbi:aldehyde dehydrogenase family protein [Arthrobacter sp. I2-34]|uniref:Aldehyde dehydrogenase n=1 Tax=Arthrobacter hankyongi TaxID=2904801 RepID=A0ABS9LDV1_9MICC|nr:aldehyde dehydrogenase family protein [Arthrobacter hankyongi]MCG2624741.1 aldehyde dehydrogenase family protein [Arthrobacter hankyongi]